MIVDDPDLRAEFRSAARCEHCGSRTPYGCDPAHVIPRGLGGAIDHRWNVVSLCRECHTASHAGQEPSRERLLEIAAKREKTTPEAIVELVQRLRRMPKEAVLCPDCAGVGCFAVWRCQTCWGSGTVMPDGGVIPAWRVRPAAEEAD